METMFETKRLVIRKFREDDAQELFENHMDEEVKKWFPNECYADPKEALDAICFFDGCVDRGELPFVLAAELKDKGIKVSALCPGSVSTEFANVASNGARKEVLNGKDPVAVVAHCIKKAKRGKRIILWSTKWKLTAFMSHFVGRYLCARYTYKYNKRPSEWK